MNGNLVWISDGYIASETFPIAKPGALAGSANRQPSRRLRRCHRGGIGRDPHLSEAYRRQSRGGWLDIAGGVVLPANSIPPEIGRVVPYPAELLQAQGRVMEGQDWESEEWSLTRIHWAAGTRSRIGLGADTSGLQSLVIFENEGERAVASLLQARMVDGWESLKLVRFDSSSTLPSPQMLESRWGRFPPTNRSATQYSVPGPVAGGTGCDTGWVRGARGLSAARGLEFR